MTEARPRGSRRLGARSARRGPASLFRAGVWRAVEAILEDRHRPILLVFDVDGTLAPIVRDPDRASVPARTLDLLSQAARARNVSVVVLSARTGREMERLLPGRGVRKAAHYGIGTIVPASGIQRTRWRRDAATVAATLEHATRGRRPARVERKGITVALHDRGVSGSRLRSLRRAVASATAEARRLGFEPVRGNRVVEFVPRGHGKAAALRAILRRAGARKARAVFYWGDSEADEPAFAALRKIGYTIRVGRGRTRARHRVEGPRDVARFLAAVVQWRGH